MPDYRESVNRIPWTSTGRDTVASRVCKSLLPVGRLPFRPMPAGASPPPFVEGTGETLDRFLMEIIGTAIQGDGGKLATCLHVVKALDIHGGNAHILARTRRDNVVRYVPYPIQVGMNWIDPRTMEGNSDVDIAVLIVNAKSTPELPYDHPAVTWGRSEDLGVGDRVLIAGFPLGRGLFVMPGGSRGVVQPTVIEAIVSAIIPATNSRETRLLQLSAPTLGGISGGAVFDPTSGHVVGMLAAGLDGQPGVPLPISYAIPSEVIAPFVATITFSSKS